MTTKIYIAVWSGQKGETISRRACATIEDARAACAAYTARLALGQKVHFYETTRTGAR